VLGRDGPRHAREERVLRPGQPGQGVPGADDRQRRQDQVLRRTIKLTVGANGTIGSTATVTSSLSPSVTTQVIPPGFYQASDGTTCAVTNITLTNGRIQSFFRCASGSTNWELSVAGGPISAGHPYQGELVAAGADQLPDTATYTWGIVTAGVSNSTSRIGACTTWPTGHIVGAKTNGNLLILSKFDNAPFAFQCNGTLTKQ
jgi:hypothetical protein